MSNLIRLPPTTTMTAQPAPVQEPVALPHEMTPEMLRQVQTQSELGAYAAEHFSGAYDLFNEFWRVAIDAAPQRTWVGLTDDEVKHEWEVWRASLPRYRGFAKGIEAKLKERNNG